MLTKREIMKGRITHKVIQLFLVLQLLLSNPISVQKSSVSALSRCEYVCQADSNCRSGECVLVYCIDSPYCFKFCMQCGYQVKCQSAGPYCYLLESSSANVPNSFRFISISIGILFSLFANF